MQLAYSNCCQTVTVSILFLIWTEKQMNAYIFSCPIHKELKENLWYENENYII